MSESKWKLFVVSHTHWDREWYQTFQQFRRRLVGMMDDLIEQLESGPDYRVFHMDGQTIVLRDYLEIRPEMSARLAALIRSGRIVIGPWYVMPDEFLVFGESIVRNLRRGIQITRTYGVEPLGCGYVTDIFGHNSQFPQILRGFGIDNALLYRGIGDYPKDTFVWRGADGSEVMAMKMDRERSYSNFYFAIRWPFDGRAYDDEEVARRMQALIDFSEPLAVSGNLLMMDGVDHIEIEPQIPRLLETIQRLLPNVETVHARLDEYVAAQRASLAECDVITGELYNVAERGINNQVLKNVLSSMVHLKQANDRCERLLTRWVEPFSAYAELGLLPLHGSAGLDADRRSDSARLDNSGFVNHAWDLLMENHPHDSICGCSLTEVHQDNEYRFKQVEEIGEDAFAAAAERLVSHAVRPCAIGADTLVVFNPDTGDYTGVVIAKLELPPDAIPNVRLIDANGDEVEFQITGVTRNTFKKHHVRRRLADYVKVDLLEVAFHATVPAGGYTVLSYTVAPIVFPGAGDYSYREFNPPLRDYRSMSIGDSTWENDHLRVEVRPNGTFSVRSLASGAEYTGVHVFEDRSDAGDGWNWRPVMNDSVITSVGCPVTVGVVADGPLVTEWEIRYSMQLPVGLDAARSARSERVGPLEIRSRVRMRRTSPVLEFSTSVDNRLKDHRLRVCFRTGLNTNQFHSTTPFAVESRDVARPKRSRDLEYETGVFPNQGVVAVTSNHGSVGVFNRGLYECEVSDDPARVVALTLFRSFANETRRDAASMGYMIRHLTFDYAVGFYDDASLESIVAEGERWRCGTRAFCGERIESGSKPAIAAPASFLRVDNRAVLLSACERRGERIAVRLYNIARSVQTCRVELGFAVDTAVPLTLDDRLYESGASTIDLATDHERNRSSVSISLQPAEIITIALTPAAIVV